jgi:hypothetical protein
MKRHLSDPVAANPTTRSPSSRRPSLFQVEVASKRIGQGPEMVHSKTLGSNRGCDLAGYPKSFAHRLHCGVAITSRMLCNNSFRSEGRGVSCSDVTRGRLCSSTGEPIRMVRATSAACRTAAPRADIDPTHAFNVRAGAGAAPSVSWAVGDHIKASGVRRDSLGCAA